MDITVFDEHHSAFVFWEEALSSGKISKGSVLLHVDWHPDMNVPPLTESVYTTQVRRFARDQLDIGDFIVPAILRGVFREVIFLGRGDPPQPRTRYQVGSLNGEGIWIVNKIKRGKMTRTLFPDLRAWTYSICDNPKKVPRREVVLDIDLDYFCCNFVPSTLPILRLSPKQQETLRTRLISKDRYRMPISPYHVEDGHLAVRRTRGVRHLVFNSAQPWIEYTVASFVRSLRAKPRIVSICRSVASGYTPVENARFVERVLIEHLLGRAKRIVDPCEIENRFFAHPFVARIGNILYNPLNRRRMALSRDQLEVWQSIGRRETFGEMHRRIRKENNIGKQEAVDLLFGFITALKASFFIADEPS